jgi:hypothetical protein
MPPPDQDRIPREGDVWSLHSAGEVALIAGPAEVEFGQRWWDAVRVVRDGDGWRLDAGKRAALPLRSFAERLAEAPALVDEAAAHALPADPERSAFWRDAAELHDLMATRAFLAAEIFARTLAGSLREAPVTARRALVQACAALGEDLVVWPGATEWAAATEAFTRSTRHASEAAGPLAAVPGGRAGARGWPVTQRRHETKVTSTQHERRRVFEVERLPDELESTLPLCVLAPPRAREGQRWMLDAPGLVVPVEPVEGGRLAFGLEGTLDDAEAREIVRSLQLLPPAVVVR